MILGVDGGLATCGWALLDETRREFMDLGVIVQPKTDGARTMTLERARRITVQAQVLAQKVPGCSRIVVEQMSFPPGGANAMVPIALGWGALLGIVAMLDPRPRLLTLSPQRWQREVVPYAGKQVDYEELAEAAAAHILRRHPKAHAALMRIPPSHRSHALDAAMIALVGALRPHRCDEVGEVKAA